MYNYSEDQANYENRSRKRNHIPKRTSSGFVRDEQNEAFERLNREQEERERQQKEQTKVQKSEAQSIKKQKLAEFQALGPEPECGFIVAVRLLSGKRINRKYTCDQMAKDVYTWISSQDEMFVGDAPIDYVLKNLANEIDPEKTLEQQGIKKRLFLTIEIFDP
jgi:hypothetical protein